MKHAWIKEHAKQFNLLDMCDAFDVSLSGYRAWQRGGAPERKRITDKQSLPTIESIHTQFKGAYGSPTLCANCAHADARPVGTRGTSHARERHTRAKHKRRYKVTTNSKHGLPVAANLLARNFTPAAPDQVWTSDITYLWTD